MYSPHARASLKICYYQKLTKFHSLSTHVIPTTSPVHTYPYVTDHHPHHNRLLACRIQLPPTVLCMPVNCQCIVHLFNQTILFKQYISYAINCVFVCVTTCDSKCVTIPSVYASTCEVCDGISLFFWACINCTCMYNTYG